MSLEESFGKASKFTDFDSKKGKITFNPDASQANTYVLKMSLNDGRGKPYERSMNLVVNAPIVDEEEEIVEASSAEEDEDKEDEKEEEVLALE